MSIVDYWLTTPRLCLRGAQDLQFAEARLRILGDADAASTREAMTKRLAGPARATDTYGPKVDVFRGVTSLALRLPGGKGDHEAIREIGQLYELLIFVTEAFALKRSKIHRLLGIDASQHHASTDLILPVFERRWRYSDHFSTRTIRRATSIQGLPISKPTKKRFASLGLSDLAHLIVRPPGNDTLKRVRAAIGWLDQSLAEKDASAAAVKTCIGFESLFGFDKHEPLRQSISERVAFVLGRSAADRPIIAKAVREFYDHRSSIVHGGGKKQKWAEEEQRQLDRLLLVSAVSLAHLAATHPNVEALRAFFDGLKWASAPNIPPSPISDGLLRNTTGALLSTARGGR